MLDYYFYCSMLELNEFANLLPVYRKPTVLRSVLVLWNKKNIRSDP